MRAWLHPAGLQVTTGDVTFDRYDVAERAYRMVVVSGERHVALRFAGADGPVYHPGFLFATGCGSALTVPASVAVRLEGRCVAADRMAVGRTRRGETVVFLNETIPAGGRVDFDFN